MNLTEWLGFPWSIVRERLEALGVPYTVERTGAPGRAPYGDDVRVVQIRMEEGTASITVCAFSTEVK